MTTSVLNAPRRQRAERSDPDAAPRLPAPLRPDSAEWFWVLATLAGVGLRLAILWAAPPYPYHGDHSEFVRWGIQATDQGLLTLYDHAPPLWPLQFYEQGQPVVGLCRDGRVCNYPPGSTYLLYASGLAFKAIGGERLINTPVSRLLFESWAILADVVVAAGCAAVVGLYRPGARKWIFLLVLLLPPLWWDSAVWGQMDSVVLAPLVWMLWAMLKDRWLVAGVLCGLAATLKPQAVLCGPLWLAALVLVRPRWRVAGALGLAVLVLLLSSLPFTLHSGLAWWRLSYAENLLDAYSQDLTLKAFNIWYVVLLVRESNDAGLRVLGLTCNTWGSVLLALALAGGFILIWRQSRGGGGPGRSLLLWSGLSLLALVMFPTRVHERYLLIPLVFLAIAAGVWPRMWYGWVALMIVASVQVTWPQWQHTPAGAWPHIEPRLIKEYQASVAQLSPDAQSQAQPLSEHLAFVRAAYGRERSRTAGLEWTMVILALAGLAATAGAALGLSPALPPRPAAPGRGVPVHSAAPG